MKSKQLLLTFFFILQYGVLSGQAPSCLWVQGGVGHDDVGTWTLISTDASGNVSFAGRFFGNSMVFDTVTIYNIDPNPNDFNSDFFIAKYNGVGNLLWIKSGADFEDDFVGGSCMDPSGNEYFSVSCRGPVTFDSISLPNSGLWDMYIGRYDESGNIKWVKKIGSSGYEQGEKIAMTINNNLIVTGVFDSPTISIDTTILTNPVPVINLEIFIAIMDTSGNTIWAKNYGGAESVKINGVSTDTSGNIYVAGYFGGNSLALGNDTLINTDAAGLTQDLFVFKCDPSGNLIWSKAFGGENADWTYDMCVSKNGEMYLTGRFDSKSIAFDTITIYNFDTIQPSRDLFLAHLDASGNVLSCFRAGYADNEQGNGCAIDSAGNLWLTGTFSDSINFGGTTLTGYDGDMFIVKFNPAGSVLWSKTTFSPQTGSSNFGDQIAFDNSGYCFVSGVNSGPQLQIDNCNLPNPSWEYNPFIIKLDNVAGVPVIPEPVQIIHLFPNPTDGKITVTADQLMDKIIIVDLQGRIITKLDPLSDHCMLRLDQPGIYFISVSVKDRTVTRKLVVCRPY